MIIKDILIAIGLLIFVVGVSEFIVSSWWIEAARKLFRSTSYRWLGLVALFIGLTLVYAAALSLVNLRWIIWFLGLISVFASLAILVVPGYMRSYSEKVFLNKPRNEQLRFLWITGFIRIVFGAIILYGVISAY